MLLSPQDFAGRTPEPIDGPAPLAMSYLPGAGDTLVISLAGVGTQRGVQPPPEFFKISAGGGENHVLFVSDASRSWLNGPGIAARIVAEVERCAAEIKPARIVALGNSMGGSMALLLAGLTRIDTVIAVVPQFSAKLSRVPEEKRWAFFRKKIADWPFEAIDRLPTDRSEVYIFHGDTPDEAIHRDRFPSDPKAKHFVFPGMDHNLAKTLRRQDHLGEIMALAIRGKPWQARRAIARAGGVARADYDRMQRAA